jgi:hypothetical protein
MARDHVAAADELARARTDASDHRREYNALIAERNSALRQLAASDAASAAAAADLTRRLATLEGEWDAERRARDCTHADLTRRNEEYRRVNRLLASDVKMFLAREHHAEEEGTRVTATSEVVSTAPRAASRRSVATSSASSMVTVPRASFSSTHQELENVSPKSSRTSATVSSAPLSRHALSARASGAERDLAQIVQVKKRGLNDPPFLASSVDSAPLAARAGSKPISSSHTKGVFPPKNTRLGGDGSNRMPLSDANTRHGWTAPVW